MAQPRDFYEILGVSRTATRDEIQQAYRKLARAHHPDVNKDPAAEDRFKDVSEAYDVLSDPDTRRRYDEFGPDFRRVPEGVDPDTWNRARSAGPRGAGAGPGRRAAGPAADTGFTTGSGENIDLDDLLGGLFGGRARRGWGPIPGADQEAVVELTVEEAYHGTRRSVTLEGGGQTRTLEVTIPAGVTNDQRIRLAGQGGRGTEGASAGDLFLIVRVARHPRYRVEGRDLHVELPVAPWEAALGTTAAVDTPDGEAKVKVPAGTSSGRRLRLRGRGLPNPRGTPGDLLAEVKIMVPGKLSPEERRLFTELTATSTFSPRKRQ